MKNKKTDLRALKSHVRPHPGPLPQERGNGSPRSDGADVLEQRAAFPANDPKAAMAMVAHKFFDGVDSSSLSPGERAGVRADVQYFLPGAETSRGHA